MRAIAKVSKKLGLILAAVVLAFTSFTLTASPAAAETYTVKMGANTGRLAYVPEKLTVSPGDDVEFVMNKLAPHNVVFEPNRSADPSLAKKMSQSKLYFKTGDSFTVHIPEDATPGDYSFYCQPHRGAGMVGKLTIAG